jgi:hypothetical protein
MTSSGVTMAAPPQAAALPVKRQPRHHHQLKRIIRLQWQQQR